MKSYAWILGIASCLALSAGTGCKAAKRVAEQAEESSENKEEGGILGRLTGKGKSKDADESPSDEKTTKAMNKLIDCINNLDGDVHQSYQRYASWLKVVDGKVQEPTGKERRASKLSNFSESRIKACREGVELGKGLATFKAVSEEYGAALESLIPIHEKAYKYYDHEDWKDDKFAQAKEMHAELVAAFEKFDSASDKLRDLIEAENDKGQREELAKLEKAEGKKLSWHRLNVMLKSKEALRIAKKDEPELTALENVTNELEKALEEANAYIKANEEEAKKVMMLSMWTSQAESYFKALKGRVRRVRDKTPYGRHDTLEGLTAVEGSPGKVVYEYNQLISRSNSLR